MPRGVPPTPSGHEKRSIYLTPDLSDRLDKLNAAFAERFGESLSLPQLTRNVISLGCQVFESRLGISPGPGPEAPPQRSGSPRRHNRHDPSNP